MSTQPQVSGEPANGGSQPLERWSKAGPVISGMPADQVTELQERSEASVGEPGGFSPFGFAAGALLIAIPLNSAFRRRVPPLLSRA